MFIQFIRAYIGSIRLFLTLLILSLGLPVVISDVWCGIDVSQQTYTFLIAILVQVIVYQYVETQRPS